MAISLGILTQHFQTNPDGDGSKPCYRAEKTPSHSWVKMDVNNPLKIWITIGIDPYPDVKTKRIWSTIEAVTV